MRNRPFAALLAMVAAGCDRAPAEPRVTVGDPVMTLPAVSGRPGAAYFMLRTNLGPMRLTGISSPRIGRIELHETRSVNGVSRMTPLRDAGFSPAEPLSFAPGGRHAMLFEIDPALRVGASIPLTFRFDRAPPVTVQAEIRGPGDVGHARH
jgi:periplasmic copper chaperone A